MSERGSFEQQYNKLQEINKELNQINDQPIQQELIQQTDKLKEAQRSYDEFWSANEEVLTEAAYNENALHREFIDLNLDFVKSNKEYERVENELDQAREKENWDQVGAFAKQLSQLRNSIKIVQDVRVCFGMSPKETYKSPDAIQLFDIIGQTLTMRARKVFEYLVQRQGERCLYIDLPFKKARRADQPITQQEINSIKKIIMQIRLVLQSFLGKQARKLVLYNQKKQYCLLRSIKEIEGVQLTDVKDPGERFNEVYQYFQEYPKITQEKIVFNYLMEHRDQFVAIDSLVKLATEQTGKTASSGAISVAIVTLRQRLGDNLKHPFILMGRQRKGYCLVPPEGATILGEIEPAKDEGGKKIFKEDKETEDKYDEWKILRESTKPPLSPEETRERTKSIQNLGAECKRLLEQEIIPAMKGGEEGLKQSIHIFNRKIPDNEQYKTGYRWYRFGTRSSVIEYLDSIINSPDHPGYKAYQDFKMHHQKREQEIATLLEHNLALIISRAFKYKHYLLEPRELVDEAVIGFLRAFDSYDPKRAKLSTYATIAIDNVICSTIKQMSQDKTIIQREVDDTEEIADPRSQQEFDLICTREELNQAIKQLPERTQEIIRLYFENDLVLREIGERFNLGRERIRQIIDEALAQLRRAVAQ